MVALFGAFILLMNSLYGAASSSGDGSIEHMFQKGQFETLPFGYMVPIKEDELSEDSFGSENTDGVDLYYEECPQPANLYSAYCTFQSCRSHASSLEDVVNSLHWFFAAGFSIDRLKSFTENPDINVSNCLGYRFLHCATLENNDYVVGELLKLEVDVDARNVSGDTPLHCSAFAKCLDAYEKESLERIIDLLMRYGADINAANLEGYTPLHCAVMHKNRHMIRLLIDRGANIDAQDKMKRTPLFIACKRRNFEVAKLLIEHGAKSEHRDKFGGKPIGMVHHPMWKLQFHLLFESGMKYRR